MMAFAWSSAAATAQSAARPPVTTLSGSDLGGDLARVMGSLAAVVALILLLAWLLRRLQQVKLLHVGGQRRLQCLESIHVGTKERLLLVRIDQQELLLGTSPQGLRTLHVLPPRDPDALPAEPVAAQPGFDAVLRRWMRSS